MISLQADASQAYHVSTPPPDDDENSISSKSGSSSSSHSSSSSLSTTHKKKKKKGNRKKKHRSKSPTLAVDKKVSKLLTRLSKAATLFQLSKLKTDNNPRTWRDHYLAWIECLRDVLRTQHETIRLLDKYPKLPAIIKPTTNQALGNFFRAYSTPEVKSMLNGIDPSNGLLILEQLQQISASVTTTDRMIAYQRWFDLAMHTRESILGFIRRHRKTLQALADVSLDYDLPTEFEQMQVFLRKVTTSNPNNSDLPQLAS